MSDNSVFKVPKDKLDVMIHLHNGVTLEGSIFLESSLYEQTINERVILFLEDDSTFFPVKFSANERVEFVNKEGLMMLEHQQEGEFSGEEIPLGHMHIENIAAVFNDGSTIAGTLTAEVPEDRARLSDCLNLPNRFLILRADSKIYYIKKSMLQRVGYTDKA